MKPWKTFRKETPKRKISIDSVQIDRTIYGEIQRDAAPFDDYQIRWAIAGSFGLYTGQCFTRKDAIEDHCEEKGKSWEICKRHGDRAVKVIILFNQNASKRKRKL